ncbi:MAG: P-loop NTPase [Deltaproteobacteria bacterium]|nr:P-loop NTPase [Deltaproteobacteria bacterium]
MAALLDKRLVVVSGKGGVGKSTVAAALALGAARAGKRTLLCEVNADERVAPLLGHPAVGADIARLEDNLFAVNVRPREATREYVLLQLKFRSVYDAVFENRVVRRFLRFIPSLQELVVLGKILYHVKQQGPDGRPAWDLVVMDAPATGHAVTYLSVPQVILDTVPPGPMSSEAAWMRDILVDSARTAAVLVTLPEDMPVNETVELACALSAQVKVHVGATVLNAHVGERFSEADVEAAAAALPSLGELARAHRARAEQSVEARARLAAAIAAPVSCVPRLYLPHFGRSAIEQVLTHLQQLLRGTA